MSGIATIDQIRSMDYGFEGQPFTQIPRDIGVEIRKMDYVFNGIPFVSNYETEAVTTEVQFTTESITIADTLSVFSMTCNMSADISLGDSLAGILLVADMSESIGIADAYGNYNALCKWTDDTVLADSYSTLNTTCGMAEGVDVLSDMDSLTQRFITTSDEFSTDDSLLWGWLGQVIESLDISDQSSLLILYVETINDSFIIYDTPIVILKLVALDAIGITEVIVYGLTIQVNDQIIFVDLQTNNWNGREILSDEMTLWDTVVGFQRYSKTISDEIAFADSLTFATTITILEIMGFTGIASAMLTARHTIEETADFTEDATRGFMLAIGELLDVIDVSSLKAMFYDAIEDAITASDTTTNINNILLTANDTVSFVENASNLGTLYSAVSEALELNVTVEIAGEVYECYVLNTPKFYPSVYSGFDFNSYCVYQNRAFGANSTGIYELTGDTDAGAAIHTGVIMSATDFQSPNQKRFRRAYLGISGDSPVMIFETAEGQREVYSIDSNGKTVASSELKSRKWKLSVAEFDTLNSIKLIPVVLTK